MKTNTLTPTPGYVIVRWVEEETIEGETKTDTGIILDEAVANRLKKEKTHLEWDILAVSVDTKLTVGSVAITSKHTGPIKVEVGDEKFGIMAEVDIAATFERE